MRSCRCGSWTRAGRRGMSLLEVAVAAALLAVLLSASTQMLRVLSNQQRAAERRVVALQAVQAVAEQIGNLPAEQVTADMARQVAIPEAARSYLPASRVNLVVAEEAEPVAAKRVSIELSWSGPGGQPAAPVRLTTWVFAEPRPPRQRDE